MMRVFSNDKPEAVRNRYVAEGVKVMQGSGEKDPSINTHESGHESDAKSMTESYGIVECWKYRSLRRASSSFAVARDVQKSRVDGLVLDNEPRNTKLETLVDMLLAFPMPLKRSRFCGNGRAARASFIILQVFFVLGLLVIYIGRLLVKTSRVKKAVRQTTRIKRRKIRVSFLGLF